MGLKIITQPSEEPFTIEQCRAHLNVEPYEVDSDGVGTHPDDALIMAMQSAAREHCEDFTGLSLVQKTYELALNCLPAAEVEIPMPPVVEIVSVKYADADGTEQVIDPSSYLVDGYQMPAQLFPAVNAAWPATSGVVNAVRIRYVAGYGDDSDSESLPHALAAAILLVMGHLYRNREDSTEKVMTTIPISAEALMRPKRIRLGAV